MKRYQQTGDTNQLPLSNVYQVCESKEGTLWLACLQGGLTRYNRSTETFSTYRVDSKNQDADANVVLRIEEARDGRLWLRGAEHGVVYVFDPRNSQFKRYAAANSASAFTTALCFYEAERERIGLVQTVDCIAQTRGHRHLSVLDWIRRVGMHPDM